MQFHHLLYFVISFSISFGSLTIVCPTGDCNYHRIQDAIDSIPDSTASLQDTILVEQGTYYENLIIEKSYF